MSVQASANVTNFPFILSENSKVKENETVVQDAERSGDIERHTVMSYDPTTAKWGPFINEAAVDGTQFPRGIIMAKIEEAAIIAGDVETIPILVGDAVVDQNQLVIEAAKTLATIINVPVGIYLTVEEALRLMNIYVADTIAIDGFENPAV